jgi:hypothetical protein
MARLAGACGRFAQVAIAAGATREMERRGDCVWSLIVRDFFFNWIESFVIFTHPWLASPSVHQHKLEMEDGI